MLTSEKCTHFSHFSCYNKIHNFQMTFHILIIWIKYLHHHINWTYKFPWNHTKKIFLPKISKWKVWVCPTFSGLYHVCKSKQFVQKSSLIIFVRTRILKGWKQEVLTTHLNLSALVHSKCFMMWTVLTINTIQIFTVNWLNCYLLHTVQMIENLIITTSLNIWCSYFILRKIILVIDMQSAHFNLNY